jgi:RNA polymerase sigma-70 factor (ECF subfamily)
MPVATRDQIADALERVAKGDRVAFGIVYDATSMKLYGVVRRILGRRDVADEILQEVYLRVWQRAGEFNRASASPITWMVTIARNRALDEAKRRPMHSIEDHPALLELADDDDPHATAEHNEHRRRLVACLNRLDPARREVVLLAYDFGMTREEIAVRVGRPAATVKTWLRRSLAQLKECLGQ